MDTRLGLNAPPAPVGADQTAVLNLPGPSTIPATAAAVVLNIAATEGTSPSYLTVYPGGGARPFASNLNFVAGQTVPNLVVVPVGPGGQVNIYNAAGAVHVVVDVVGWLDVPSAQSLAVAGLSTFGSDVVIDPTSTYAYISNTGENQIEVLRLADKVFEDPIFVGSQPMGLDLTPAGDRLYVADRGSAFVSVVDVATRTELHRIAVPSGFSADRPYSIAVLSNGKALLSTTFYGSGFGGRMFEINLATEVVTQRNDFYSGGATTEYTSLRSSGDHTAAVITAGNISSGPVFRYSAATDTFTPEVDTARFTAAISTNLDGTVVLLNGGPVFDAALNLVGSVPGCGTNGVAVNAAGTVGYGLGMSWDSAAPTSPCATSSASR